MTTGSRVLMQKSPEYPAIVTLFESLEEDELNNQNYRDIILRILKKLLPSTFFEPKETSEAMYVHQKLILQKMLPLISCSDIRADSQTLSFFSLSKYRPNSFKFFFEMISRWLAPGRRLNVVLVYASDFRLIHFSEDIYTICEVIVRIGDLAEHQEVQRNFPIIGSEIILGMHSQFYAQRILEIKGLSADDKTASIQQFIAYLVNRFPNAFNQDVFAEMQHVLVSCRDDFKAARQSRHLSRIISIQYLFRKSLKEAIKKKSHQRHLRLKIFRAFLNSPQGRRRVLGILVGVNFLRDQETFGEKHLIKALQHYIPSAIPVADSFLIHKLNSESICIAYIEIEKKDAGSFSFFEMRRLRRELPANLKNRVEHHVHPVFMPRNEEEIIRNMLALSSQIQFVRDIPQVWINFEEQTHSHLFFTVILARVLKPGSCKIGDLFRASNTFMEYLHDRTKEVGFVRNRYVKEASVFRLKLPKERFLRPDHSVDLHKARRVVVKELFRIIGDIRDYNGGMISKQDELLGTIRELLADFKDIDEVLLENFFYSLAPVIKRNLIDPKAFKVLFLMLIEGLKEYKQEGYYLKIEKSHDESFILLIVEDHLLSEQIKNIVQEMHFSSIELCSASVNTQGCVCMGYICSSSEAQKQNKLFQAVENRLKAWEQSHSASLFNK